MNKNEQDAILQEEMLKSGVNIDDLPEVEGILKIGKFAICLQCGSIISSDSDACPHCKSEGRVQTANRSVCAGTVEYSMAFSGSSTWVRTRSDVDAFVVAAAYRVKHVVLSVDQQTMKQDMLAALSDRTVKTSETVSVNGVVLFDSSTVVAKSYGCIARTGRKWQTIVSNACNNIDRSPKLSVEFKARFGKTAKQFFEDVIIARQSRSAAAKKRKTARANCVPERILEECKDEQQFVSSAVPVFLSLAWNPEAGIDGYYCPRCRKYHRLDEYVTDENGDLQCMCGNPFNDVYGQPLTEEYLYGHIADRAGYFKSQTNVIIWIVDAKGDLASVFAQVYQQPDCDKKTVVTSVHIRQVSRYSPDTGFESWTSQVKGWKKGAVYSDTRSRYVQSKDALKATFKASNIGRRGLLEYIKITTGDDRDLPSAIGKYAEFLAFRPSFELLVKAGMDAMVQGIAYKTDIQRVFGDAKNPASALGLSKSFFRKARNERLLMSEIVALQNLLDADQTVTWDDFVKIRNGFDSEQLSIAVMRMTAIHTHYSIRICRIQDYIDRVYQYQCIDRLEAIQVWGDYLHMATALGYDLGDKTVLYPTSLRKAHDIATFAYNAVSEMEASTRFEDACSEHAELAYQGATMSIVVPTQQSDLVREGQYLKHCVRSYIQPIADGSTFVVFVRKNDDLEKPYVTVEVNNGKILQMRGFCNRLPDRQTIAFIDLWAKAKGLKRLC